MQTGEAGFGNYAFIKSNLPDANKLLEQTLGIKAVNPGLFMVAQGQELLG